MITHTFLLAIILLFLPFLSAVLTLVFKVNYKLRDISNIAISLLGLTTGVFLLLSFKQSNQLLSNLNFGIFSKSIYLSFQVETITIIFASLVSLLWPFTILYTVSYLHKRREKNQVKFLIFMNLALFATFGIAFSGNLVTTFIFYEALTLLTYPLVVHQGSEESIIAGRWYLGILIGTSLLLFLPAIILTFFTSSGNVSYTIGGIHFNASDSFVIVIFLMFLFGISKAALMPFHRWLPKAMVAPVPASALFHAVAVVKSGIFVLMKIVVYIFSIKLLHNIVTSLFSFNWLLIIAAFTIISASLINLYETHIKKILAYSTISQLGYIILCLLMFTKIGIIAAILFLVGHSLAKIALFFSAGAIITFTNSDDLKGAIGSYKELPSIMNGFLFCSLSLIGMPFTAGFNAKYYLIKAAISSHNYFLLPIIIVSGLLIALYMIRIFYYSCFIKPKKKNESLVIDSNNKFNRLHILTMTLTITVITILNFAVYIISPWLIQFVEKSLG